MDFFGRSPWGGSPFLGQPAPVPASRPTVDEGRELTAHGGRIVARPGSLWFFPDRETAQRIEGLTGRRPPEAVPVSVGRCSAAAPYLPTLGGFIDPGTGYYCEVGLPREWKRAWEAAGLEQTLGQAVMAPGYDPVGIPPYWGEWGVVDKGSGGYMKDCGKVGPYQTIEEAFGAAAEAAHDHGAELLPTDGFAQVKDSRGRGVGPVT